MTVFKFNCETYLVIHGLKMYLLIMGVIEKPTDIGLLLISYRIFSVLGRTAVLSGVLLPVYSDLFDILMLGREPQVEEMLRVLVEIYIY